MINIYMTSNLIIFGYGCVALTDVRANVDWVNILISEATVEQSSEFIIKSSFILVVEHNPT